MKLRLINTGLSVLFLSLCLSLAAMASEPVAGPVSDDAVESEPDIAALADEVGRLRREVDELKAAPGSLRVKPNLYLRIRPDFMHNVATLGRKSVPAAPGLPVSVEDDNRFYVGSRLQLGVTIEPTPGFRMVATIQDSRKWGEEASFRSGGNGSLDLFEGYMEFVDVNHTRVNLRAGRFTMDFGSSIHVNSGSSGSTGQVYDGVWLSWVRPGAVRIDAFTTLVKTGLGPVFSDDTREDYESFSGLYLSTEKALKWLDADVYGFYLDDAFANFRQKLGTVGGRVIFKPVDGLLISGEAAVQFGEVSSWTDSAVMQTADHLASIFLANASYRFNSTPTRPYLGLQFLYASGDSSPWDTQSNAFKPTFGSTHNFLGYMDVLRAGGIWDIGPQFWLEPVKDLQIMLDYHIFSQTSDGGLYQHFGTHQGSGTRNGVWTNDRGLLIRSGNSSFIGHEFDFTMIWKPNPWIEAAFAYCAFFPGSALDNAAVTGVTEDSTSGNAWVVESVLGGRIAHRMLVWATFSY